MTEARTTTDLGAPIARRVVSPALFTIVVVSFFLPFVALGPSARSQALERELRKELGDTFPQQDAKDGQVADYTGWQLVIGDEDELNVQDEDAQATQELVPPRLGPISDAQAIAIAAFAVAIVGIAASWLALWPGPVTGAGLGIGGLVLLFLLKGKVEAIAAASGDLDLFISFQWQLGYWLAMVAFGLAAAWSIFRLLTEARWASAGAGPRGPVASTPPPAPGPPPPPD